MIFNEISRHFNLQLTLACLLIAFSQFNYGFDDASFSAVQAMNAFEKQFGEYNKAKGSYAIPAYFLSLLNGLPYIGFAAGLLAGSLISARWGRKIAMACMSAWVGVTATILITATSKEQILAGRILHYCYTGMELAVVPVFQSEIVPGAVRGLVVGTYQLSLIIGRIVMGGVTLRTSTINGPAAYRIPFGLFYIVPFIVFCCVWFIPESPRWLLLQDRIDEARQSHFELRSGTMSAEEIEAEFNAIHQSLLDEPEQGKMKELVVGVNKKRTAIIFWMALFQQATGQAFASQYGAVFIKSLGTVNPFAMTLGNSALSAFSIICTLLFVDRIGRRSFLLIGSFIQFASLLTMGALGVQNPVSFGHKSGIVACLSIFVVGFGASWGPLTFVVATELPALRLRDKSQRVAALTNILFNFLVNFTLPYLLDAPYANLGSKVGFIYGGISLCALFFVFFWVPECRGRSLEEIDLMFHERVPLKDFKNYRRTDADPNITGASKDAECEFSSHVVHVESDKS